MSVWRIIQLNFSPLFLRNLCSRQRGSELDEQSESFCTTLFVVAKGGKKQQEKNDKQNEIAMKETRTRKEHVGAENPAVGVLAFCQVVLLLADMSPRLLEPLAS
jgi:hypothetical protein